VTSSPFSSTRLSSRAGSSLSQEEREAVYRRLAAKREAAASPGKPAAAPKTPVPESKTVAPFIQTSVPIPQPSTRPAPRGRSVSGGTLAAIVVAVVGAAAFISPRLWPAPPVAEAVTAAARASLETEVANGAFGSAMTVSSVDVGPGAKRGSSIVYPVRAVMRLNEPLLVPAPAESLAAQNRMAERVRQLSQDVFGLPTGVFSQPPVLPPVFEVSHSQGEVVVRNYEFEAKRVSGSWRYETVEGTLQRNPLEGVRPSGLPAGAVVAGTTEGDRALGNYLSEASRFAEQRIAEIEGRSGGELSAAEAEAATPLTPDVSASALDSTGRSTLVAAAAQVAQATQGPAVVILDSRPAARTIVIDSAQAARMESAASSAPQNGRLDRRDFVGQNYYIVAQ